MTNNIASLATAMRQQQLSMDVGIKLMKTALDSVDDQGSAVVKLLESAQLSELEVNPHLGSIVDVRA
ncbi:MAG: putative motility protein [Firmicutes bacterium]|nr:putative motility protein [Bacillota bacterium]